jgi:hypothetical protein
VRDRDILSGATRTVHQRDYKPAWQRETFRISIMRKDRRLTEWRVFQLSTGPSGFWMEIGWGITRSLDGALSLAHNAADSAPPMPRRKKEGSA